VGSQVAPAGQAAAGQAGAATLAGVGESGPSLGGVPAPPSEPTRGAADARGPARAAFVVPADIAGRVVAIAAPIAACAFLLPFAAPGSIVLGGAEGADYLSDWGLAAPANLVPFGLAILLFVLAVVPSGLADWFRFGVLPLVLGGGLAAIGWTAVTWSGGYGVGVVVLLGAAVALLGAGVLAVRNAAAGRHVT
jgi:hypothetical protein